MKIFTTFQKASEKLGIYRPQSFQLFQTLNIKNFGILICFVFFSLATILYLISEAKTFDEYSESLLGFVVGISIVGCFIVIIWKTADIYRLIDNFERVITQRMEKSASLKQLYENANAKVEKWSVALDVFMVRISTPLVLGGFILGILWIHRTRGLQRNDYKLPFFYWLPYLDWKASPYAYLSAMIVEYVYCLYAFAASSMLLCLLLGSYILLTTFVKDIVQSLKSIDEDWKTHRNRVELTQNLHETLRFHAEVKQLTSDFAQTYEFLFAIYFLFCLVTISCQLLTLQLQLSKDDTEYAVVFTYLFGAVYIFGFVFFCCEIGHQLSEEFDSINNAFYELDWKSYPDEIKRKMPVILQVTQQPVELSAYGNFPCSRETFKRVVNAGYSYFTIFRELY